MPKPPRRYWLFKSEPSAFSYDDLARSPKSTTAWEGVRNYQARNLLRDEVGVGDRVLFYHSSAEPTGVAGIAEVVRAAYPDPTQFDPKDDHFDAKAKREDPPWLAVDVRALESAPRFVALEELKRDRRLSGMLVVKRGSRLSIQPVTAEEWRTVLALGGFKTRP